MHGLSRPLVGNAVSAVLDLVPTGGVVVDRKSVV